MKKQKTIIPPEYAGQPFFLINPDGHIEAADEAVSEYTGVPAGKLHNTDFTSFFTMPAIAGQMLQQAITETKAENYQLTFLSNGNRKKTSVIFNAYYNSKNGAAGLISAVITPYTSKKTAVKKSFQKIQKEISDYKYALDESSIVAITDQKGIIKHVNENFCKI